MNWLDPQTQAQLQPEPPEKLAPSKTADYAIVLLNQGSDPERLQRAIARINGDSDADSAALASQRLPIIISADLTYGDAVLGQFELICCDAAAAILSAAVLEGASRNYLAALLDSIRQSPEFKPCRVTVAHIPKSEGGYKFADQFLGVSEAQFRDLVIPVYLEVPFKKARIMKHWAEKIGVLVSCAPTLP